MKKELWTKKSNLIGLNINDDVQVNLLNEFTTKFKREYNKFPLNKEEIKYPYQYYVYNPAFTEVDGEILYCMIRYFKPKRIIEIGSGRSTYVSAQAIVKNNEESIDGKLISIEPYPNKILKQGFPGLSELIISKIEDIPLSQFEILEENDILFIDSSHVLKIGSDVQYEFLEIIPRLKKGVIIHIHDIFLPAEYPKDWILKSHLFWNEQYILQAFLAFNNSFEILWGSSYMHLEHSDMLQNSFKSYRKDKSWPGSFWIRKIK